MTSNKKLLKIKVSGRVQGVGFRHACMREARYRGLHGFVMNMADGSVYIEAEGPDEQLNELIKWCRQGPAFGSVKDIQIETSDPKGLSGFVIKY